MLSIRFTDQLPFEYRKNNLEQANDPPTSPTIYRRDCNSKIRAAEDGWNSRAPVKLALAYSQDSTWRNRSVFVQGRDEIEAPLFAKWAREHEYKLIKELWAFTENRIAVRFAYEWRDDDDRWFRSYGNENWEFDADGLMRRRIASINDLAISEADRKFHWPLGRRPDDHPGLTNLGL